SQWERPVPISRLLPATTTRRHFEHPLGMVITKTQKRKPRRKGMVSTRSPGAEFDMAKSLCESCAPVTSCQNKLRAMYITSPSWTYVGLVGSPRIVGLRL